MVQSHSQRMLAQQNANTHEGQRSPAADVNGHSQSAEDASNHGRASGEGVDAQRSTQNVRQAWEHMEEVSQILKTAFPLLIMSLETIVEQISQRLKGTMEEECYRLLYFLSAECAQVRCVSITPLYSESHPCIATCLQDVDSRRRWNANPKRDEYYHPPVPQSNRSESRKSSSSYCMSKLCPHTHTERLGRGFHHQ